MIVGYAMFLVFYLFTIFTIIHDINKTGKIYEKKITIDLTRLNGDLKLSSKMKEFEDELEKRLKGAKIDSTADDQLLMEAAKLTTDEYKSEM